MSASGGDGASEPTEGMMEMLVRLLHRATSERDTLLDQLSDRLESRTDASYLKAEAESVAAFYARDFRTLREEVGHLREEVSKLHGVVIDLQTGLLPGRKAFSG